MKITWIPVLILSLAAVTAAGADSEVHKTAPSPARQVRIADVDLTKPLPQRLTDPEGTTRWDLTGVTLKPGAVETVREQGGRLVLEDGSASTLYSDDAAAPSADNARRWLLPDRSRDRLRPGASDTFEILQQNGTRTDRLRIETEIVGIGWVHLPSGPHEAVLQRALVSRKPDGARDSGPDVLMHRWIDPRAGVLAEIAGPAAPDGRTRLSVTSARVVQQVLLGAATLKIYVDELDLPTFTAVAYGRDKGANTTISSLVPDPNVSTMGDLIALDTWDFSANNTGAEIASTSTFVDPNETCNVNSCGYSFPGAELDREDKNFDAPDPNNLVKVNTVTEQEVRASDLTIWLRAGSQNEGKAGGFGNAGGETRFCYVADPNTPRNQVPLWRFPNQDAGGWYMQAGDPVWAGGPGATCQQTLFNEVCGGGGLIPKLYAKACGNHTGTQFGEVVKGGVVILPSGHTFNALLVRYTADFCVYIASGCADFFKQAEVRQVNYLWQVPYLGTVTRLESAQLVPDLTSYTTLADTDIKFGLFPPRTISVTGSTDNSVSISWDPGLDTHRINDYHVYWDTDTGGGSSYAFDDFCNTGSVTCSGTTATISGLSPSTTYYITVTSVSDYTDPSTGVTTRYESLLYPTQVSGDPSFVYPIEVQATTTGGACIPTAEVTGVDITDAGGGDIQNLLGHRERSLPDRLRGARLDDARLRCGVLAGGRRRADELLDREHDGRIFPGHGTRHRRQRALGTLRSLTRRHVR